MNDLNTKQDIYIKDNNLFYKNIKNNLKTTAKVHMIKNEKDIVDDSIIDSSLSFTDREKIYCIHALNIKDMKKRYEYIYDVVCDFLDSEFKNNNICEFQNNKCVSVRNNGHCKESNYGCCYGTNRGLCKNFQNGKCIIKSISCKLFTCRYLKNHDIKYKIEDINLLKYFFNIRQKYILNISIFKDKDEVIELLLKYK